MHERAKIPQYPPIAFRGGKWSCRKQNTSSSLNVAARRLACFATFASFLFSNGAFLSFLPTANHVAALRRSDQSEDRDRSFLDEPLFGSPIMPAACATLRASSIPCGFAIGLRRSHLNDGGA